jgi:hypothetical protein
VNSRQAKEVLFLYRPWSGDGGDPEVAEALEVAGRDPELAHWFEQHCAIQSAMRAGLRGVPVPEGLREQILSEVPAHISLSRRNRRVLVTAGVAVLAAVLALAVFFSRSSREGTFAAYRGRMVKFALRGYQMDLETNELGAIRRYLAGTNGHGDVTLPTGLARRIHGTEPTGCAVLTWQAKPVSMICFGHHGKTDLWLFVIDRGALPDAPEDSAPRFERANNTATTASWSTGGRIYFLAGVGNEARLKQYFRGDGTGGDGQATEGHGLL